MQKQLLIILSITLSLNAQNLKTSISEVLQTNPIIQERLKNYNSIKEDITSAKAGYYPKVDLSLGVGVENSERKAQATGIPDKNVDFDVYQNSLTYTQNIFKGFETSNRVEGEEYKTTSAAYSYIEKVNDTSFEMVNTYLQVMRNQELLQTAKSNVRINDEIFVKVQKLYDAGLTTLSEVNKIESSLSLAKSNLVVQENTILDVSYNLQRVLGRYLNPDNMSKPTLDVTFPLNIEEAAQYAIQNNPSLLVSNYNIKLAQATHKEKKSPFYPHLDIELSQSMNKDLNGIEGKSNNFKAMAYVKFNIFNGFADSAALQKSISQVHQEVESKNNLRRQVIEGLNLSWAANEKLSLQLEHLEDYKKFSLKTLKLYSKEYDLGRRSLLDLLSAQNDFIGSKVQIINTEYSMLFAKYRILDAMGTLVPTVMGDQEIVYSNVGLGGKTPSNSDDFPIRLDNDKDLIADDKDVCNNSLLTSTKDIYGCQHDDAEIKTIERYNGFLFDDEKLTEKGKKRLDSLVKQLTPYGLNNLKVELLANAFDEDMKQEKLLILSTKRATEVKNILVNAGVKESHITIYSNADKAPMFIGDDEKNNRVDIVIKKIKVQ